MSPQIKLSGITRLEDARYASAVGADYLGFIQKSGDIREIDPNKAREIIDWVVGPKPVGIFENDSAQEVCLACQTVGFQLAQLDGNENPDVCHAIQSDGVQVIKTIRIQHDASLEQLRSLLLPYQSCSDFIRLDVFETSLLGGEGESLNWRVVRELASEFALFLAGTIKPDNAEHTLTSMRPFGLDVSTSVETSPGVMDFDKLGALFDVWNTIELNVA